MLGDSNNFGCEVASFNPKRAVNVLATASPLTN